MYVLLLCMYVRRYFVGKKAMFDSDFKKGNAYVHTYVHVHVYTGLMITPPPRIRTFFREKND